MKKNKNIKIASAEDILMYLRSTAVDGISNATKTDVARYFGYKSSNGNGFLNNFKFLEEKGFISDISSSNEKGLWRINMNSKVVDTKKKKNKKGDVSKNLNLSYLIPIEFAGRKYIPLTSLAKALNIDRHFAYNAASASNRLVFPYTRSITVTENSKQNTKKAIEVEGLSFLFDRLKKHVDQKTIDFVIDYVLSEKYKNTMDSSINDGEVYKQDDLFEAENNSTNPSDEQSVVSNISLDENSDTESNDKEEENDAIAEYNTNAAAMESDSDLKLDISNPVSDSSEMLMLLDGMLNILSEHTTLKTNLKILEEENSELKQRVDNLKKEGHKLETESYNYHSLKAENEKLKKELASLSSTNNEILSKANMIKKYILDNNASF